MYNIVVIGGMAAGCKAAVRLRRLFPDYRITIIEKSPYLSYCLSGLSLFASGEIDDIAGLNKTPFGISRDENYFKEFENIDALTETEATEIDTWKHEVTCKNLNTDKIQKLKYDILILSTGSKPCELPANFSKSSYISNFHSPDDAKKFRNAVQKGEIKKAIIIGGGYKGCELAEALVSLWGIETIIIEKEDSLFANYFDSEFSKYIESTIKSDKILTLLSTNVVSIETDRRGLPVVVPGNGQKLISDYVFNCCGTYPETSLAEKTNIKIGKTGGIIVDEQLRTNIPNIYAAGSCTEIKNVITDLPDNVTSESLSIRMGRAAADSIAGKEVSFKGTAGTTLLKLFDNNLCSAGITEKQAEENGISAGSVIGCWSDRPDFHPDVKNIFGKLIYKKPGFKLLGLQLIGEGEIARYVDIFSQLLKEKRTVKALLCLEHAFSTSYSPPFSPLNYLSYMALNQEKDKVINYNPLKIDFFKGKIIDVRESFEAEAKPFPLNSTNIPLSEIRSKINDFDKNSEILFFCAKGSRSYETARLFVNNGFKQVAYLGGGYVLFNSIVKLTKLEEAEL